MKKPKAILYDCDGMITHGGRFSDTYCKEFGLDLAVMKPFFDGPFKQCLVGKADLKDELSKVVEIWDWKGTVDELMQYWFSIGADKDEKMYASISRLKEQGLIVCLATNNEKYRLQYLCTALSYDTVFDHVFSAFDLGAYKQSTEGAEKIFQTLKEKYGISDKGEVMYWDDRDENVENLNKMGFNAQLYRGYDSFKTAMLKFGLLI